jgi:TonB family protein
MRLSITCLLFLSGALVATPLRPQQQSASSSSAASRISTLETHPPRIQVPADFEDLNVARRVPAMFPPVLGRRMTGTVVLRVIVARDGAVQKVTYISGPENLAASASDAVKQWKYKPASFNDQPVEVETTVNIVFSLPPPPPPLGLPGNPSGAASDLPSPPAVQPIRIRVPAGLAKKFVIRPVLASHPPHALFDLHLGGTVLMHVIISQDGSVQKVNYISGPEELKRAAMDAMQEWRYKPALLNGEPVEVDTTSEIVFTP